MVMDNLNAHKAARIREAIEVAQARVSHLPPNSLELPAIELCWNKLKTFLRTRAARTRKR